MEEDSDFYFSKVVNEDFPLKKVEIDELKSFPANCIIRLISHIEV